MELGRRQSDRSFNESPDLLAVVTADGVLKVVNASWGSALGYRLDELIGRLLASRIQPGQLTQLRELLKKMQQAARGRSVEHYYPLNVQFHDMLAQFTGNGTLVNHYRRLVNELHLYRRETLARGPDSFPISTREHAAIVDALARRDGDRAGKLMYEHAMESRERLHAALKGRRQ